MRVETRSIPGTMIGVCVLLAASDLKSARAQNLDNPTWPMHEWLTSTPEDQGMDSSALAKLVTNGESQSFDSFLIVRHGRIVVEAYYDTLHRRYSASDTLFDKGNHQHADRHALQGRSGIGAT